MIMPPSPALRVSPGRELRATNHKRSHSFESGMLIREKDDDLTLFNEMQIREKEAFLLQSAEDLDDSFSTKLRHFSDFKLGISIPVRGENSDLLVDGEKNDYDWLLTPPDTPLFPSLDDEPPLVTIASRGRPRSQPISISRSSTMEKSHRSSTSRGSASPNRLSPSPRSVNSTSQMRGRPFSGPHSSPTPSVRHATPSRRPTTPPRRSSPPPMPSTSVPRSSTPTPRRMSMGSSGTAVTPGARGVSPIKSVRGNSASPKIRAWQTNIPGFSSDAPPNLRTSLADRPASYVRGSSPASRNSKDLAYSYRRQSMSPTASRSISSSHSHDRDRDRYSSYSKGSIASSGDDDLDSLQSGPASSLENSLFKGGSTFSNNKAPAFSKKPARIVSSTSAPKRSFESAPRLLDRKSPNMFRPLLSSVPSTTFYTGKASCAHRSLMNSLVTTSSNASSDHGTNIALDIEGSDHNEEDMACEFEKLPFSDNHEEIFVFEKSDIVNEHSSDDIKSHDSGLAPGCDPVVPVEICQQAILPETSPTSTSCHAEGDFSEVVCLEDAVLCSKCGRNYSAVDAEDNDINLCPECSRKEHLLSGALSENTTAVAESLSGLCSKKHEAVKPFDMADSLVLSLESSLATEKDDTTMSESVGNVEQDQATCPELSQSLLQENFPSEALVEGQHSLANHLEMSQSAVSRIEPNAEFGQQPLHHNDYQTSRFDVTEGAGISILLKRSSSSKGPVVQGRTFTASTISYDDLSYASKSMSSLRSSIGHSSFSASSSADFSSARQIESRMQRQLSSRKGDMENRKSEISLKSHSSEVASPGITAYTHPVSGISTCKHEENLDIPLGNSECQSNQGNTISPHKYDIAFEDAESNGASSTVKAVVDEDNFEYNRILDASTSESSREDIAGSRSFSEREATVTTLVCSIMEAQNMLDGSVLLEDDVMEVPAHSSTTIPQIETKEVIAPDSQIEEPAIPNGSDRESTTSVINPEKFDSILEESTVIVDYQGREKGRSLTLEEATDTILFCSSIVHDLAYSAATIAIGKENQDTLESSRPMVTILGKSNTDRRDLRNRTGGKRVTKSQKPRQRRIEMSPKSVISKTENDENTDESTIRNVGLPNQVDSMKPPKLESKCNCSIM